MGQASPTHRVTLKLALEDRDSDKDLTSYTDWRAVASTETTITLPVPDPDSIEPLVADLVRSIIAISGTKGVPLTGERPEAEVRAERVLERIAKAQEVSLTEAGYAAVLEGIRMILAGEAPGTASLEGIEDLETLARDARRTLDAEPTDGIGHDVPDALRA